ncbi:MAG: penicillin-binding transpeptidase domain-containing protein [Patescibacteria group bacterium]
MESLVSTRKDSWLSWFLRGLLFLGFLFLLGRLVELQIIKGNYFRALADDNRIKRIPIYATRGRILARGGEVLEGKFFAHAGGYVAEVNQEEVGKTDPQCPDKGPRQAGSLAGRSGLQAYYDCLLRGVDGEELVEVDTMGKAIRTLGVRKPVSGIDLKTTISLNLQKKVGELLDKPGAVVISDPKGEILAIYSSPSFDPSNVGKSLNDPTLPLFNRAITGVYHPGSIFKIVTSVAVLEDKKITPGFVYDDPGVIKVNDFSYSNWYFSQYGKLEGAIDLPRAIARSTDTLFYKLGELEGATALASWADKFGLGKKTGIDLPGESTGLVPTPDWKERVKGESWFLGNTYHMAIGQGDLTATPLQMNMVTSVIANQGKLCTPHIIEGLGGCMDLNIEKPTIDLVREGMMGACSSGGTAPSFFDFVPQVACKTGTAETNEIDKTHAWFSVFTPVADPQIVITVLVEKGGEGSQVAAPIAKEILKYWLLMNNP